MDLFNIPNKGWQPQPKVLCLTEAYIFIESLIFAMHLTVRPWLIRFLQWFTLKLTYLGIIQNSHSEM